MGLNLNIQVDFTSLNIHTKQSRFGVENTIIRIHKKYLRSKSSSQSLGITLKHYTKPFGLTKTCCLLTRLTFTRKGLATEGIKD